MDSTEEKRKAKFPSCINARFLDFPGKCFTETGENGANSAGQWVWLQHSSESWA